MTISVRDARRILGSKCPVEDEELVTLIRQLEELGSLAIEEFLAQGGRR
jgi:hypothetical protein